MSFIERRSNKLLVGMGISIILLVMAVWAHFIASYFSYSEEIRRLQPLMARLVGMEESRASFEAAGEQVRESLSQLSLSSEGGADAAAAELQRKVRAIAAEHGMSVSGSQVMTSTEGEGYQQLAINMTIKGKMTSLPGMLVSLNELEPRIVISSAQVSPARSRKGGGQNINVRISVLALRARS